MANPQAENGHTDIANEILEALCQVNLSKYEWRIVMAILRKTYGWHKKVDGISLTQFETVTKIPSHNVCRTINHLEQRQIIEIARNGKGRLNHYKFQKDYTRWLNNNNQLLSIQIVSKPIVSEQITTTINSDNQLLSKLIVTKETKQKKLNKRNYTTTKEQDFLKYKDSLRIEYPHLDIDKEWDACKLWWSEGDKKMTRPKSAFRNWLNKAHVKSVKEEQHQETPEKHKRQKNSRLARKSLNEDDPDRFVKGKYGHMVRR